MRTRLQLGVKSIFVLCLLGVISLEAEAAQKYRVVYVRSTTEFSKEDSAAVAWLQSDTNFTVEIVPLAVIRKVKSPDVVWFHLPDSLTYHAAVGRKGEIGHLRSMYDGGTKFVFTDFAALLPYEMGIESSKPSIRIDTIANDWLFDKRGFQGFRGHPIFSGLFGGEFVWDPDVDQILPSVGYFGTDFPANGRVIAVEKSYVFVRAGQKLVLEYSSGRGLLVTVGSSIYFAPKNSLRLNLQRFIENVLLYASGKKFDEPRTYWHRFENVPREFSIHSDPIVKSARRTFEGIPQTELLLTRRGPRNDFFDVAGRRALIMGKENGGIDEMWVHPFRILRDYQAGMVSGDSVLWFPDLPVRVEVRPESFTRIYSIGNGEMREVVFASLWKAGGIVHYESTRPLRLVIRFRCDLRWMWPYDAGALGDIYYGYDNGMEALHIKDTTGSFYCLFGGDLPPLAHLAGRFQSVTWTGSGFSGNASAANQVYHACLYDLNERDNRVLNFAMVGTSEGMKKATEDYQSLLASPESEHAELVDHYRQLLSSAVRIDSPDKEFNNLFAWAIVGTDRFFAYTPTVGKGLLAGFSTTARGWDGAQKINGRPGYAWYFGRDSEWSSFAIDDYGGFALVKQQLEFLQQYQDLSGKIFHEISTSGVVHYDASDATPLYIILAAHYLRASGDIDFVRKSWPHLRKAMDFLYSTDTDGDGLIENTGVGHGWVEGGALFGVHTEFYLAALWCQVLNDMAFLAPQCGQQPLGAKYAEDALRVKQILNKDFWNDSTHFSNHGKFRNGAYHAERTILPAVGAYFDFLDDEKVKYLLDQYAGNGFSSDWGVRILSSTSSLFDPQGYHYGSVWPLFTGWTALAEYEYGNSNQGFMHIWNNLFIKNYWALGFVEEVMNGAVYKPSGVCPHQCWSETNILHPAITGMIGWKPNAVSGSADLKPRLPLNWDTVTVSNLRIGNSSLSYTMKRGIDRTEYSFAADGPGFTINFQPELPEGMELRKAIVNGKNISVSPARVRGLLAEPIVFTAGKRTELVLEHRNGIGVFPVTPRPEPGDSSKGWRVISTQLKDKEYSIMVEGRSGRDAFFTLQAFDNIISHVTDAEQLPSTGRGITNLRVTFDQSPLQFSRKVVTVRLQ